MFYFPFTIEQSLVSLTCDTFVVYSYKYEHDDGRVSYPLCFIFSSPVGKKKMKNEICSNSVIWSSAMSAIL